MRQRPCDTEQQEADEQSSRQNERDQIRARCSFKLRARTVSNAPGAACHVYAGRGCKARRMRINSLRGSVEQVFPGHLLAVKDVQVDACVAFRAENSLKEITGAKRAVNESCERRLTLGGSCGRLVFEINGNVDEKPGLLL